MDRKKPKKTAYIVTLGDIPCCLDSEPAPGYRLPGLCMSGSRDKVALFDTRRQAEAAIVRSNRDPAMFEIWPVDA